MGQTNSRTLLGLAVGLLVVTAGCAGGGQLAGGGDGGDSGGQPQLQGGDAAAPQATERVGDSGGGDGAGEGAPQVRQRAIIRTGQVELEVADFEATQRNLTATVEGYGGFVSDSQVEVARVDNDTYRTGRLVLRVPRENFSAMMARAQAAGEVQSVTTNSEDVTEQLVDVEARLTNLRAERDRLRQLYRNASDTEDVLAVEERLSEVQGEIERLEARKQALERQVALSTVRVELREPRPDPVIDTDRWFETPVLGAFLESVSGVVTSLRALAVAAAYALPYAFVYGPVVAGVVYGVRRLRRDRSAGDSVAGESVEESDETETGADEPGADEPGADEPEADADGMGSEPGDGGDDADGSVEESS